MLNLVATPLARRNLDSPSPLRLCSYVVKASGARADATSRGAARACDGGVAFAMTPVVTCCEALRTAANARLVLVIEASFVCKKRTGLASNRARRVG